MNILFFLTPKAICSYLLSDYSIRQALERMESSGYANIPVLDREGKYVGTLTEGDLLWAMKNICGMDLKAAEGHSIKEIESRRVYKPVAVTTDIEDLIVTATDQNFVPVVDDKNDFIGIVTRRAIMRYCLDTYIKHKADE